MRFSQRVCVSTSFLCAVTEDRVALAALDERRATHAAIIECCVCMCAIATHACMPCAHRCACAECVPLLMRGGGALTCPVCRDEASELVQVVASDNE